MLHFRKVGSAQAYVKVVGLLRSDVEKHGGTASEIVDMHGQLVELTVCAVPWGSLLVQKDVSYTEALAWSLQDIE